MQCLDPPSENCCHSSRVSNSRIIEIQCYSKQVVRVPPCPIVSTHTSFFDSRTFPCITIVAVSPTTSQTFQFCFCRCSCKKHGQYSWQLAMTLHLWYSRRAPQTLPARIKARAKKATNTPPPTITSPAPITTSASEMTQRRHWTQEASTTMTGTQITTGISPASNGSGSVWTLRSL